MIAIRDLFGKAVGAVRDDWTVLAGIWLLTSVPNVVLHQLVVGPRTAAGQMTGMQSFTWMLVTSYVAAYVIAAAHTGDAR